MVPVKRPRVTIPLVRRVKATIPVKLFARSAALVNSSAKLKLKCSELQTIKTELTQIKSNIDALLGRLEQIAEQQKTPTEVRKKADGNKSEISQEDTASEADMNTEEPLNGEEEEEEEGLVQDDCDDELENSHFTYVEDSSLQVIQSFRLQLYCSGKGENHIFIRAKFRGTDPTLLRISTGRYTTFLQDILTEDCVSQSTVIYNNFFVENTSYKTGKHSFSFLYSFGSSLLAYPAKFGHFGISSYFQNAS
ncbi:hypothetical protein E2320_009756 [Naja naja]|nr:hypothetical protein E2320_009756 [Naja naja]